MSSASARQDAVASFKTGSEEASCPEPETCTLLKSKARGVQFIRAFDINQSAIIFGGIADSRVSLESPNNC